MPSFVSCFMRASCVKMPLNSSNKHDQGFWWIRRCVLPTSFHHEVRRKICKLVYTNFSNFLCGIVTTLDKVLYS